MKLRLKNIKTYTLSKTTAHIVAKILYEMRDLLLPQRVTNSHFKMHALLGAKRAKLQKLDNWLQAITGKMSKKQH